LLKSEDIVVMGAFLFVNVLFSLMIYFIYDADEENRKTEKNRRYKLVLWEHIIAKTMIPAPILSWVAFVIIGLFFDYRFDFDLKLIGYSIAPAWLVWFGTIFISRKIYRRIQRNKFMKLPSSFYDKK